MSVCGLQRWLQCPCCNVFVIIKDSEEMKIREKKIWMVNLAPIILYAVFCWYVVPHTGVSSYPQSDPFVEIAKAQEGGLFTVVYRSQPIMKTLDPKYVTIWEWWKFYNCYSVETSFRAQCKKVLKIMVLGLWFVINTLYRAHISFNIGWSFIDVWVFVDTRVYARIIAWVFM